MVFQFSITFGSSFMLYANSVSITATSFYCLMFYDNRFYTSIIDGVIGWHIKIIGLYWHCLEA
jgi:hypothetical protein